LRRLAIDEVYPKIHQLHNICKPKSSTDCRLLSWNQSTRFKHAIVVTVTIWQKRKGARTFNGTKPELMVKEQWWHRSIFANP
jgi:hypothetical protein